MKKFFVFVLGHRVAALFARELDVDIGPVRLT